MDEHQMAAVRYRQVQMRIDDYLATAREDRRARQTARPGRLRVSTGKLLIALGSRMVGARSTVITTMLQPQQDCPPA